MPLPVISGAKIASAVFSKTGLKVVIGLAVALAVFLLVQDRNRWKSTATLRQEQLNAEKLAHRTTVANYRAAAEEARRKDAENVLRVKAAADAIAKERENAFNARIAAARATASLRRNTATRANSGGAGTAPVSCVSAAAGGVTETTCEDRLPDSDRLIATEQAIQLDELIKWVKQALSIDIGNDQ